MHLMFNKISIATNTAQNPIEIQISTEIHWKRELYIKKKKKSDQNVVWFVSKGLSQSESAKKWYLTSQVQTKRLVFEIRVLLKVSSRKERVLILLTKSKLLSIHNVMAPS